jgi:hypothetical protein
MRKVATTGHARRDIRKLVIETNPTGRHSTVPTPTAKGDQWIQAAVDNQPSTPAGSGFEPESFFHNVSIVRIR